MGIPEWMALIALAGLVVTLGGKLWQLATRLSTVESKADAAGTRADAAGINVAANSLKVDKVVSDLSSHREETARDYVSYKHMVTFENRIVEAISQLGNRIDGLFTRVSQPHA